METTKLKSLTVKELSELADKLKITEVDIGRRKLRIICGAKNIENRRKACRDHRAKAQNASFSSIFTRGRRNQQKINDFRIAYKVQRFSTRRFYARNKLRGAAQPDISMSTGPI